MTFTPWALDANSGGSADNAVLKNASITMSKQRSVSKQITTRYFSVWQRAWAVSRKNAN